MSDLERMADEVKSATVDAESKKIALESAQSAVFDASCALNEAVRRRNAAEEALLDFALSRVVPEG